MAGLGLLTAVRVRYIRFPLSWRLRALIMGMGQHCPKTTPPLKRRSVKVAALETEME
jgi:hypothetical protein